MDLNPSQMKLVESEPNGHSLIRGVAGSGKTTIALYRTLFLQRNYCFEDDDRILLATFNRTLINYLQHLLNKLEKKDYYRNIFSNDSQTVDVNTVDSIIKKYSKNAYASNLKFPKTSEKTILLTDCLVELRKKIDHPILEHKNASFLLNEIEWIKACNYVELEEYQHVDRFGRQSYEASEVPQRLTKNSPARKAIFELMMMYTERLAERGYIDFLDCALAALANSEIKREDRYTHIIVDEAQDLTRVQLEFLKRLYEHKKYSSFTFVMDTAQSIYPRAWLVKGRSFTSIGLDMSGKSNILSKSYRNTWQIARSAYSLIEKDANITGDENYVTPIAIDKQGCEPVITCFENEKAEADYIINKVKELLAKGYDRKDIAVIARFHNQLTCLQEFLHEGGIPAHKLKNSDNTFESNSINLLTLHAIKGLESKVVFIIGLNHGVMPYISKQMEQEEIKMQESNERKLLYVGMTRATELLFLSSSGPSSPFFRDIETGKSQAGDRKVENSYQVKSEDYLFRDNLSVIDDMPEYIEAAPVETPSTLQKYFYTELRAPRGRSFVADGTAPGTLVEINEGVEKEYSKAELTKIPVFKSVAAGAPSFVDEHAEDEFYLPREWVKDCQRLFMVKVQGDSMVDVEICEGDYVLVRKQDTADNTDIVVAAIEDEATLKGYMKINGQVHLIPKNKKYQPIKVESDKARVLGKVLGIIKPHWLAER